ncbi:MAG: HIT domain-containing protein [Gemmatales bacterium]|nr:HIT domain-containing protein [Gemmatales bacterium]MDW8387078.1 HIT domain-containing protein [Gemmatales bacterium]
MDPRLELLWAPWRHAYVAAPRPPGETEGCFICSGLSETADRQNLIVHRTRASVVILNRYPYNAGHLLIAPQQHKARPAELSHEEILDSQLCLARCLEVLDAVLHPDGYNIGMNLGTAAGAGLPGHLHWHVVPRWVGDTNFMPVLYDVKVISQSLNALWELLDEHFRKATV